VILAAATAVLTAGLVLVQAQLLASGVTRAFLGGDTLVALAPVLVALLVVVACRAALAWLAEVAAHRASTDMIRQLRSKLVAHTLRLGPRHGGLPRPGSLPHWPPAAWTGWRGTSAATCRPCSSPRWCPPSSRVGSCSLTCCPG
jgi:ABC-type multidrug transport system fused ATPase/permease subunit